MEKKEEEMDGNDENEEDPLGFPIQDTDVIVHMKNIPPYFLPNFHGLRSENLETFLFEFEILCRSYDYTLNTKKLRFVLVTLKDRALKWFMILGTNSIRSWNDMQKIFLEKYKDHDLKEEIFRMNQKEDESLEDIIDRFMCNVVVAATTTLQNFPYLCFGASLPAFHSSMSCFVKYKSSSEFLPERQPVDQTFMHSPHRLLIRTWSSRRLSYSFKNLHKYGGQLAFPPEILKS